MSTVSVPLFDLLNRLRDESGITPEFIMVEWSKTQYAILEYRRNEFLRARNIFQTKYVNGPFDMDPTNWLVVEVNKSDRVHTRGGLTLVVVLRY